MELVLVVLAGLMLHDGWVWALAWLFRRRKYKKLEAAFRAEYGTHKHADGSEHAGPPHAEDEAVIEVPPGGAGRGGAYL